MKKTIKTISLIFIFLLISNHNFINASYKYNNLNKTINTTTTQNNIKIEKKYTPTIEEIEAYNICSKYVKSNLSLSEYSYKNIKKMYSDFLNDYKNDECGYKTPKNNKYNGIKVYDPLNNTLIFNDKNYIIDNKKYHLKLNLLKIKITTINKFLIENNDYSSDQVNNIFNRIKSINLSKVKTVSELQSKIDSIKTNTTIIKNKKKYQFPIINDLILIGSLAFILTLISFYIISKYLLNNKK